MIKCQTCGVKELYEERKEKMDTQKKVSSDGKIKRLYFHKGDCINKYLELQELKKKEKELRDELSGNKKSEEKKAKTIKCQICNLNELFSEKEEKMDYFETFTDSGGRRCKYCHKGECSDKYKKKIDYNKKENKEKDELNKVIRDIHGLQDTKDKKHTISSNYWQMVQDIRNGTERYKVNYKKKYKQGVPYSILKDAYLMARKDIEWAKLNKQFRTTFSELKYCLLIAHGKISDVYREKERNEQSHKFSEAKEKEDSFIEDLFDKKEIKYKKQKSEFDISHILGDD